jgi:hypothetical protein
LSNVSPHLTRTLRIEFDSMLPIQLDELKSIASRWLAGEVSNDDFLARCLAAAMLNTGDSTLDLDRRRRCGFPEVVFGEGKSTDSLRETIQRLLGRNIPVFITRVSAEKAHALRTDFASARYNDIAQTFRVDTGRAAGEISSRSPIEGRVAIITAGTSDRPVAEEARETLDWMGVPTDIIQDVGVAGLHRLIAQLDRFRQSSAIVVIAGMEAALPSVVGGLVNCPVIGVPTSVGYGAHLGGFVALLGMLNSCASNVCVVNIDAGFKGGYLAGLIASRATA